MPTGANASCAICDVRDDSRPQIDTWLGKNTTSARDPCACASRTNEPTSPATSDFIASSSSASVRSG
jgi:hypothetical protein